jgi:hypothetical protein
MLQSLGTLSALVVVTDTWESPSLPFLDLLCRQKHAAVVALSLECPAHRLVLSCPTVEALIPCTDPPFPEPGGYSVLIVDGASEWLARVGIAHALRSLLRQTLLFGCVVVTFHSDVVCAETLNQLVASSSCWFAVGPGSSVSTLSKRKGGKVVRAFEEVVSWNPHVVKPLDTKVLRKVQENLFNVVFLFKR